MAFQRLVKVPYPRK